MLSVEEYLACVVGLAHPLPVEEVPLDQAAGRVLARDLPALVSVPPFTNSAMDGYAVRSGDLAQAPVVLEVVGDIPAGATSVPTLRPGQAARIMTGAPLPDDADAVLQVELTDQLPGAAPLPARVEAREPAAVGRNVRVEGEATRVGDPVLAAGQRLRPGAIAAAASVGYGSVPVHRRPRVAVLATGAELVAPGEPLSFGQIPDSNSGLLATMAADFGAEVVHIGRTGDDPGEFAAELAACAQAADVVVTAGGVSAGAFEPVRQAVEGDVEFVAVAMQPGKPQAVGRVQGSGGSDAILLGLPGNPVSVFVSAWVYLRPLLDRLQNTTSRWCSLPVAAGADWTSPAGRRQFVPVRLDGDQATPTHRLASGSHLVSALHLADALAVVDEDVSSVARGDALRAYLIG